MEKDKRNLNIIFATAAVLVAVSVCVYLFINKNNNKDNKENIMGKDKKENVLVVMETNFGDIKLELFSADAPKTVENFLKLSELGFYDGAGRAAGSIFLTE